MPPSMGTGTPCLLWCADHVAELDFQVEASLLGRYCGPSARRDAPRTVAGPVFRSPCTVPAPAVVSERHVPPGSRKRVGARAQDPSHVRRMDTPRRRSRRSRGSEWAGRASSS